MTGAWITAFTALCLAVAGLVVLNLAVLRQLGLIYLRLGGSLGARRTSEGPTIGEPLSEQVAARIPAMRAGARTQLLVFMSPTCEICTPMIPVLPKFASQTEAIADMVVVIPQTDVPGKFRRWAPGRPQLVIDPELAEILDVPGLPYAVALDVERRVTSKGTFNDILQLDSVLHEAELAAEQLASGRPSEEVA